MWVALPGGQQMWVLIKGVEDKQGAGTGRVRKLGDWGGSEVCEQAKPGNQKWVVKSTDETGKEVNKIIKGEV